MERRGQRLAERSGVLVLKLFPTRAGLPDRLVLAPGGRLALVEWKTAAGTVSPVQAWMFEKLAGLGFPVTIVRSQKEFDKVVDNLRL